MLLSRKYIQINDKIIIGLSGGPDSVYLAYLMNWLKAEYNLELILAHVNYKLRGEESDADEQYCREFAGSLGLPVDVLISDLSAQKTTNGNVQNSAREIRMSFFCQLAVKHDCHKIALAHTADDNIETVLGNILRGCGLAGLSGIVEKSESIIRPLLHVSKAEIVEFLNDKQIDYRVDSSNLSNEYTRNKIRNDLIPHLKEVYNPEIESAISRLSRISSEVHEYLLYLTVDFIKKQVAYSNLDSAIIPIEALTEMNPVIIRMVIKYLTEYVANKKRGLAAFDRIDDALKLIGAETGVKSDLGGNLMCERGKDCLIIFRNGRKIEECIPQIPGKTDLPGFNLVLHSVIEQKTNDIAYSDDNRTIYLDYDKLSPEFSVRQFESGDRFQPLGMNGSKKLGDFFTDRGIPGALRMEIPVLVNVGDIVWVLGEEISELFKVDQSTETILKLWIEKIVRKAE